MAAVTVLSPPADPSVALADAEPGQPAATEIGTLRPAMPSSGLRGWWGPLAVTVLAGALRFTDLGRPDAIAFDETYYVKDALSLLQSGYEREAVDKANDLILAQRGTWDTLDVLKDSPSFVVHPPLGKWVIAVGEWAFGVTPFGWRFMMALLGTLSVLMLARIVRRLTRSDVVGTVAGLLLALDGLHIVMSRTALLDISLMFLVVAAFGLLLIDRDQVRGRLDAHPERWLRPGRLGPGFGVRPWRIAAGVTLGLACGVKWSGLWFVAFFGILTVVWDLGLRRSLRVEHPWLGVVARDAVPALVSIVGVAVAAYLTTWTGWLATSGGYDRQWAASNPGTGLLPDALRSLVEYHRAAWRFHVGLDSPHAYRSSAWSWPFMSRPTSFYYQSEKDGLTCGADRCSAEVLALGNPIIWWAGLLALGHNAWRSIAARDWRSSALLVGYLAGWLPWMLYHNRTIFTFYAIVMVPFLAGMLAISLARLAGGPDDSQARRQWGLMFAGAFLLVVIAATWFFLPIWTGQVMPWEDWHMRMWWPTWV